MLKQIQEQDVALQSARDNLEKGTQELQQEIAERKQIEDALRESEGRFRQLAENIDRVFWLSSSNMNEKMCISPAYEEICGRPCEDLYNHPQAWMDTNHPEDKEHAIAVNAKRREAGYTSDANLEYRILRPDQTIR